MNIFAIGDLHLDHSGKKSMEVFGEAWYDYENRIFSSWREKINDNDLVLIPGDISWAMTPEEAYYDLARIDKLPGKKLLLKGNHDYWWQSRKKIEDLNFESINLLQNDAFEFGNTVIYGTRAWQNPEHSEFTKEDQKVYDRELLRLNLSLEHKSNKKNRLVMTHYPPYNYNNFSSPFLDMMIDANINICIYAHLHGHGHKQIREEFYKDMELICVSADYINFSPRLIIKE